MNSLTDTAYTVQTLPPMRHAQIDVLTFTRRERIIHALVEIDVTQPRRYFRAYKAQTGESLSFTGFVIACLGRAVDEYKIVQAYRKGKRRLIIFDAVDVNMQIEKTINGQKLVVPHIVRAANTKTLREIHTEIRQAQTRVEEQPGQFSTLQHYIRLPMAIRRLLWWMLRKHPPLLKRLGGTIGVTAVGMFANGAGWGIPVCPVPLLLTIGGIAEKPGVVDGRIVVREYLCLTISMDHDVIDGAPAARFVQRLKSLIEQGYGLEDMIEVDDRLTYVAQPMTA